VVSHPRRDEVWLTALDPSKGSEIKKIRPCLVISPDEANESLRTVLIAPMTTTMRSYPTRIDLSFKNKTGQVALDQLRAVDRQRLITRVGVVSPKAAREVSAALVEMFVR
jgi:mRNA interferase MazF